MGAGLGGGPLSEAGFVDAGPLSGADRVGGPSAEAGFVDAGPLSGADLGGGPLLEAGLVDAGPFGGGADEPSALIFFSALPASPKESASFFSIGESALSAFTSFVVMSAILDTTLATSATTCGTTQVSPMPNVAITCNAQLTRWPTSSAMMSRTRLRTEATTSPAVAIPLDAPSAALFAAAIRLAVSSLRAR